MSQAKMEDIISLCKRRGFIYQGSDVYGGLSGTWDYGPLGVKVILNKTSMRPNEARAIFREVLNDGTK